MEWCWIQDYENKYKIYKNGDIESCYKNGNTKILKQSNRDGYFIISLSKKGQRKKCFYIHRLIGIYFIPNPNNKECIDHRDGNPSNNSIENLKWCSHSENMLNKKNYGKYKKGVHFNKQNNKFQSSIRINGKNKYLGSYETEEEGHQSYRLKFIELHGFEPCAR